LRPIIISNAVPTQARSVGHGLLINGGAEGATGQHR
jgi:hypothetical protein